MLYVLCAAILHVSHASVTREDNYNVNINDYQWQIQDFRRGCQLPVGVPTYYFAILLAKNCMEMKEFGPQGTVPP